MPVRPPTAAVTLALGALCAAPAMAQHLPLAPERAAGQTVTPVFEGWYRNPDGTFSLSFGYFNRNAEEVVEVPIGADNAIEPGGPDRGQPARFEPRRHWGVFAVRVPADFGEQRIVWRLVVRGDTFAIPGSLRHGWEIDALAGEAGSGNTPPELRFTPDGPWGAGPGGPAMHSLRATTGSPADLVVFARDDGRARTSIVSDGRANVPVTLTWILHRGPANVRFEDDTPVVDPATGRAATSVTFTEPGVYVLRVRANDASGIEPAGHSQCCWTNGFVKVTVTAAREDGP